MVVSLLVQAALALVYYVALILLIRLAGKRLAGQTTTFDLVVLIGLSVTLQDAVFKEGTANAIVFVITVFAAHILLALACSRSRRLRRLVRGAARPLVFRGQVSYQALDEERLSYEELLAGLRKLGFAHPSEVRLATLEETGHISALPLRPGQEGGGVGDAAPETP